MVKNWKNKPRRGLPRRFTSTRELARQNRELDNSENEEEEEQSSSSHDNHDATTTATEDENSSSEMLQKKDKNVDRLTKILAWANLNKTKKKPEESDKESSTSSQEDAPIKSSASIKKQGFAKKSEPSSKAPQIEPLSPPQRAVVSKPKDEFEESEDDKCLEESEFSDSKAEPALNQRPPGELSRREREALERERAKQIFLAKKQAEDAQRLVQIKKQREAQAARLDAQRRERESTKLMQQQQHRK